MKEEWKYEKLGDIFHILNGFAFKSTKYVPEGIRVIRITNVQKGSVIDSSPKFYPVEELPLLTNYMLEDGDLLMSLTGNVGRVGIIDNSFLPAALNQRVACLRLKKNGILKQYLYHYLNSDYFEKICISNSKGAAQLNMSTVWLANHIIPIPPLPEQERIVSFLDAEFAKIDAIKANAEKQLQDAKALFQSALQDLSSPKEGWRENSLGEIATDMYRGNGITRAQVTKDGISCVRYGEIYTTYDYHFNTCVSHTDETNIQSRKYFEYGDILFAITGESVEDIGKSVAYLGHERCLAGGDIVVMKHTLNPKFLGYVLSAPYVIKQKGFGKTKLKVVHTNVPSLKSIIISYPPSLSEQQQIAEQLDKISAKIQSLQSNFDTTVTLCNDLKQSILKDIFG